jgi:hypothetical protein
LDRCDRGHRARFPCWPLRRYLRPQGHRLRVRVLDLCRIQALPHQGVERLKDEENDRLKLGWNLQRTLAKINYRIHTDAIKESLIPPAVTKAQAHLVYACEADLLNVALFGQTAKQWRDSHPQAEGNLRDHAAIDQLVALTNLESLNAVLIRQGLPQSERLMKLNEIAISQMRTLLSDPNVKGLK